MPLRCRYSRGVPMSPARFSVYICSHASVHQLPFRGQHAICRYNTRYATRLRLTQCAASKMRSSAEWGGPAFQTSANTPPRAAEGGSTCERAVVESKPPPARSGSTRSGTDGTLPPVPFVYYLAPHALGRRSRFCKVFLLRSISSEAFLCSQIARYEHARRREHF